MAGGMMAEEISESFIKALLAEDEVGCVIRSHLYIEAQINRYLELAVIEPKYLTKLGLSYAKKVELLCCLGLDQQFRGILIGIGKLRNKFAHNLSSRLTQQVVNDLYNALPEFGRQAIQNSVVLLHQALSSPGKPQKYEALNTKWQFVLVALNMERICCAAYDLLSGAKSSNG
jgi:hypothetical protein